MSNDNRKKQEGLLTALGNPSPVGYPATQGAAPPPPPPPPPNALSSLFQRPVVKGLYYNGKTVSLDGYSFIGCRFDNCTLTVQGTNFELIECVIDTSTNLQYGAELAKVIRLFHVADTWADEHYPAFAPIRNPDGSVTVDSVKR